MRSGIHPRTRCCPPGPAWCRRSHSPGRRHTVQITVDQIGTLENPVLCGLDAIKYSWLRESEQLRQRLAPRA